MLRFAKYIIVISVAAMFLSGCGHEKEGIIPKRDMEDIYHDMFVADQWLRENPLYRIVSDTTLFFEPIFNRYGYSFADYDRSVTYYIANRQDFIEILEAVSERIIDEADELDRIAVEYARIREANSRIRGYKAINFRTSLSRWNLEEIYWPSHKQSQPGDILYIN